MRDHLVAGLQRVIRVGLFAGIALTCRGAVASDYGCQVLLCLANPAGPMAVSECVPPITKLYKDLAHFRPFPKCDLVGSSYAKPDIHYYDDCPTGTTALGAGAQALAAASVPAKNATTEQQPDVYTGIGTGDGMQPGDGDTSMPPKVCVGARTGQFTFPGINGSDASSITTDVYDQVTVIPAQGTPRYIDVFIDNKLYRRVNP